MSDADVQRWIDAMEESRREIANWRGFAFWWFATTVISFGAFCIEWVRNTR